jgi:cytochrome c-type biogenesis protein
MGATALGQAFAQWKDPLSYVAAALLALFGLHFLGVLKIPLLYREAKLESKAEPTTIVGAYVMGLAFGFGWTPCVGPALASILMVASGMGDIWRGALLLLVYGLGMTAPFIVAALFAKPFLRWMQRNRKYMPYVEKVMGAMLLVFALLIATNSVNRIADLMIRYVPGMTGLG